MPQLHYKCQARFHLADLMQPDMIIGAELEPKTQPETEPALNDSIHE